MFSFVPYAFNSRQYSQNDVAISDVTGSSELLVPGRVTATTNIPQGAMSIPIDPALLRGQPDIVQISVGTSSYGTVELENESQQIWGTDVHWIRALRLSDDCHSYNIQLRLQPSQRPCSTLNKNISTPKLIVQAVRPIESGQELLLWFSEDILAMLQMVFLTPANIQGQKKYVCTRCSALYESPNPLKLHITLGCGRLSIAALWNKLSNILTENGKDDFVNPKKHPEFTFKLAPAHTVMKQRNAMDLSRAAAVIQKEKRPNSQPSIASHQNSLLPLLIENQKNLYRPFSEPPVLCVSAFKPFQKDITENNNKIQSPSLVRHGQNFVQSWPGFPFIQTLYPENRTNHSPVYGDEAQIETLVSSLGKSKQGHVCLYCGKCYSRKYGLKIHIRTHTGYKPLKCKFCLRPFGDPSNLNKHVRLHAEGDTPYKCDLCGKILVRRRDLERHLKSRHMSELHPGRSIADDQIDPLNIGEDDENETQELTVDG